MKRVSWRVVTGLVLTAILLTALAAYFAWGATPSSNIWIQPGIYPGAPDYTIWREGSNYFAKDQNGYQAYSGTNATQITQNCIDALTIGTEAAGWAQDASGVILFKDIIIFNNPLNVTLRKCLIFRGTSGFFGQQGRLIFHVNTIGIDLTGSAYITFENLVFEISSGYTPTTLIYLARYSNERSAGWHTFKSCSFYAEDSYASSALIYDYGSEQLNFLDCAFTSQRKAVTITRSNIDGISSLFVDNATGLESTSMIRFSQIDFHKAETGSSGERILIHGACFGIYFSQVYFGGGTLPAINITGGGNYVFDSCRFETIPWFTTVNGGDVAGLIIKNAGWYTNEGEIIDFDRTSHTTSGVEISGLLPRYNANYTLNFTDVTGSTINLVHGYMEQGSDDSNLTLQINGDITHSIIYTKNSDLINIIGSNSTTYFYYTDDAP